MTARIHVDGACLRNGQPGAAMGIGVYWVSPSDRDNDISEPYQKGRSTNQRAELEAARRGILQCKYFNYDRVYVHLDSQYVLKGATEWIPRWEQNGYCNASGHPVANEEDFKRLKNAMRGIDVYFIKIDRDYNQADSLAKKGAAMGCDYDVY